MLQQVELRPTPLSPAMPPPVPGDTSADWTSLPEIDVQATSSSAGDPRRGRDYMHARFYSPQMARFFSVDPVQQIKRAQRNPQMWNRYAYAANNPLILVDPTGEFASLAFLAAALVGENTTEPPPQVVYIYLRSFAPFQRFGGGFHGDNRRFTTSRDVTSRMSGSVAVNRATGRVAGAPQASSSPTSCAGPPCSLAFGSQSETAQPSISASNMDEKGASRNWWRRGRSVILSTWAGQVGGLQRVFCLEPRPTLGLQATRHRCRRPRPFPHPPPPRTNRSAVWRAFPPCPPARAPPCRGRASEGAPGLPPAARGAASYAPARVAVLALQPRRAHPRPSPDPWRPPLQSVPVMKVREILRILEQDGWYHVKTRGSHRQYKHPTKPGRVTIAGKPSHDLAPGTLNSILKQAGLKRPGES